MLRLRRAILPRLFWLSNLPALIGGIGIMIGVFSVLFVAWILGVTL